MVEAVVVASTVVVAAATVVVAAEATAVAVVDTANSGIVTDGRNTAHLSKGPLASAGGLFLLC